MFKKVFIGFAIIFILIFIFGIYLVNQNFNNTLSKKIKDNIPQKIKIFLKKTVFYFPILIRENKKLINENNLLTEKLEKTTLEKIYYENLNNVGDNFEKEITVNNEKYILNSYTAPFNNSDLYKNKKSAYLEIYNDKMIIVFTAGKIVFVDKNNLTQNKIFDFHEIKNNLSEMNLYNTKVKWTGIKDAKIFKNYLLISVTEEIKKDCYATSLMYSKISNDFMKFDHLFKANQCVDKTEGNQKKPFKYFNGYQTGGRIVVNGNNIYLTIGDYNNWKLPQSDKSIFGKIIKINFLTKEFIIISKGHRNSQGLTFLNNDNLIFTDHGPKGGDEINILNLLNEDIPNFGWPLASYGEHYDVVPIDDFANKYAPLLKSHVDNNFEEPAFYFKDSVGISEVIQNYYSPNSFFVTSLKNKTIYNLLFNEDTKTFDIKNQIDVGERIRDIIYDKDLNLYFLYLENKPSLLVFQKN